MPSPTLLFRRVRDLHRWGRTTFYDGPPLLDYPGRRMTGYRSPNLLIGYWIYAFLVTYLTPVGRTLFLLGSIVFLAGMTALEMPIYFLSFGLVAVFLVNFVAGWFLRPNLEVLRRVPRLLAANAVATLDYTVRNRRRHRPAFDVFVDTIPFPPQVQFLDGLPHIARLEGGATVRLSNRLRVTRRGHYHLPLPVADSSFPFGLWRWGSRGPATGELLVHPEFTSLSHLQVPVGTRQQMGSTVMTAFAGGAMEFLGCREYRPGDNPRHLHARSWARRGAPVVKEFRDENYTRAALLLDPFLPPRSAWSRWRRHPAPAFEAALALGAAISEFLVRQRYILDLFVPGGDPAHLPAGHDRDPHQAYLQLAASLDPVEDRPFTALTGEPQQALREVSSAIVILLDWDDTRRQFIDELRVGGIGLRLFLVSERLRTFPASDLLPTQLLASDILAGQVRQL